MENSENRAINTNSLNGEPFPVNIDFSIKDGVYHIYSMPISVLEVMNLLPQKTFLIFSVDHYEFVGSETLSLSEVVSRHSSYLTKFDEQTLLMDKESIVRLLEEMPHYNLCLIDAEKEIEIDKVIQIIDLAEKFGETDITRETDTNVFISSHDDCYLHLETKNEKLALDLISLQIRILVSAVLNCSIDDLNFNPKELITEYEFSIMIPQS